MKRGSAGGKATAIKLRKEALERYYQNPVICEECGNIIKVLDDQKIGDVRKKKFCNHSCSTTYYNKQKLISVKISNCSKCGNVIEKHRTKNGKFSQKKYCDECRTLVNTVEKSSIDNMTKKELFDKRKGYQSARSSIRSHAQNVFLQSGTQIICDVCGYDKHIEVCHRESVSSFSDNSLISEINNISNLIGLCPNHHWEYDHGFLEHMRGDQVIRCVS